MLDKGLPFSTALRWSLTWLKVFYTISTILFSEGIDCLLLLCLSLMLVRFFLKVFEGLCAANTSPDFKTIAQISETPFM